MKKLLKFINSDAFFIILLLVLLGFYIFRLDQFPIFADEAIYLNWADRVITGQENAFVSMFDGKPPLFMWLAGVLSLVIKDIFWSGRLVSVLSLFMFSFGVWGLTKFYPKYKWLKIGIILTLISPFVFFHSRLALIDSLLSVLLLSAILAWTLVSKNWCRGILTGAFLGLAFWTKTPALFLLPFPIISVLLFERKLKTFQQALLALGMSVGTILLLKVSVWFPYLFSRSQDFSFQISEILAGQNNQIWGNTKNFISWFSFYQTWWLLGLAVVGLVFGFKHKQKLVKNLSIALILFLGPFLILGKVLAPRYYLPAVFAMSFLAAYGLKILPKWARAVLIIILIISFIPRNLAILQNPINAKLPEIDTSQYLQEWSSGIGLSQVSDYLQTQAQEQKIKILTEGYFGTLPDGLFIHMSGSPNWANIEIVGVGSVKSADFYKQLKSNQAAKIYYVGNEHRINPNDQEEMKLVKNYPKKDGGPSLQLYEIDPSIYENQTE